MDPDAYPNVWRDVCAATCDRGIAHNKAYVRYLEETLGGTLSTAGPAAPEAPHIINWANAPGPDRYRMAVAADRDSADRFYKEDRSWEKAQEDKVHSWLASAAGQTAVRKFTLTAVVNCFYVEIIRRESV